MDPEPYIPPCCIHRQLPDLIRSGGIFSQFYSQGDWGFEKLWHAVSMLVSHVNQDILTVLIIDDVDEYTLRYLRGSLLKGWISAIVLITVTDRKMMVKTELADMLDKVWYCGNRKEADNNLWMRISSSSSLIINGKISHSESGPGKVCAYTSSYSESAADIDRVRQAFVPWRSIVRLHASIKGSDPLFNVLIK